MEYDSIMSNIIDGHDAVLFTHSFSGQGGDRCAVCKLGHEDEGHGFRVQPEGEQDV